MKKVLLLVLIMVVLLMSGISDTKALIADMSILDNEVTGSIMRRLMICLKKLPKSAIRAHLTMSLTVIGIWLVLKDGALLQC